MKLAIIFGGQSTEHEVSIASATSIISALNKEKYEIFPIYINKEGKFFEYTKKVKKIKPLEIGEKITELKPILNICTYLENIDVIFPVLHGKNGEDGTMQGMLSLLNKKYVGPHTLASSLCMDKEKTKLVLKSLGIKVTKWLTLKKGNDGYLYYDQEYNSYQLDDHLLKEYVQKEIGYPLFVKPANSGSSVGVSKITQEDELIDKINEAFLYDDKVLIEEAIMGRELECAILGNKDLIVSPVGEIITDNYYSYEAKYKNNNSKTIIPHDIPLNIQEEIRDIAKKAYQGCGCVGLSRLDFFLENKTNQIILNEINTMPGFTNISMYPKLMAKSGFDYSTLLDKLIELAL